MIFEEIRTGGCMSYLVGCADTCAAAIVDPSLERVDRYEALASAHGLRIHFLIDTHTHADHFSGVRELSRRLDAPAVMHRSSPAPFVDLRVGDGETLLVGDLRIGVLHTPGHTADSISLVLPDRVLTGDTLLLGGTGRTDLPSGDPAALHASLFERLLVLDPELLVYPGHNYKATPARTLAEEKATNSRLQWTEREEFVSHMRRHNPDAPTHLTEALRTNQTGARPVAQMIEEAARRIVFVSQHELRERLAAGQVGFVILDVREEHAHAAGHIPGAVNLPRGELELLVDRRFPDPNVRILVYCEWGKVSTLAADTLRQMGFSGAVALDGGMQRWREAGHPVESGASI